jgi:hypothetical protein
LSVRLHRIEARNVGAPSPLTFRPIDCRPASVAKFRMEPVPPTGTRPRDDLARFQPFENGDESHGATEAWRQPVKVHQRAALELPPRRTPQGPEHLAFEVEPTDELALHTFGRGRQANADAPR